MIIKSSDRNKSKMEERRKKSYRFGNYITVDSCVLYRYNCNQQKLDGGKKNRSRILIIVLFFNYVNHVHFILITC